MPIQKKEPKHEIWELRQMQNLDLGMKVKLTMDRIRGWYEHFSGQVYVSFSGGKDSTVLLHLVRKLYPEVPAVFVNTGLEYPEIQKFVGTFENVKILYPEMSFVECIRKYGYPVLGKEICHKIYYARKGADWALKFINGEALDKDGRKSRYNIDNYKQLMDMDFMVSDLCCFVNKKSPAHKFEKESGLKRMTAQMADESTLRTQQWLLNGCNGFDMKSPVSNPMSFWTEQDVLEYIKTNDIKICSVYGEIDSEPEQLRIDGEQDRPRMFTTGCERTGCIFCGFGCHLENNPRFVRLAQTHPKQYEFCIRGGEYDTDGLWKPNKNGLGLGHVFDELNEVYGRDFIQYRK